VDLNLFHLDHGTLILVILYNMKILRFFICFYCLFLYGCSQTLWIQINNRTGEVLMIESDGVYTRVMDGCTIIINVPFSQEINAIRGGRGLSYFLTTPHPTNGFLYSFEKGLIFNVEIQNNNRMFALSKNGSNSVQPNGYPISGKRKEN